jgi:diguanylate cyclase (GGDEF)-like protein
MTTQPIILIVDDAPTNVAMLASILLNDYCVKVAGDGYTALAIARRRPQPDLILLDVIMPDMDGLEVCRQLKADPETMKIPIIFVTTQTNEHDEEMGLSLGAVDYITKPVSKAIAKARIFNHIRMKQQADMLETLSLFDALTHLANRRQFADRLETEWLRALRENSTLSLLMIDIDHFKEYNDHYGHGAGDRCLKAIAEALESGKARPGDLVARIGGEEFVVILPQTDILGARQIGEGLRQKVVDLQLPHDTSNVSPFVTISVGCAATQPSGEASGQSVLFEAADKMLYQAKSAGRNRVE